MKVRRGSGCRLCLLAALAVGAGNPFFAAAESPPAPPSHLITNIVQFRGLAGEKFLAGCAFELSGVVTLVDTNRRLIVLQDSTDAVALSVGAEQPDLAVGEWVSVAGSNCSPVEARFPEFPLRPSGWDVRPKFEAPAPGGRYYLTRMRGWLQPPVSGQYTFWIASDNSSELWLSLDADPSRAKRVAHLPRYAWVGPREWSKFASQRAESIWLNAGQRYYLEALQEQTTGADNLAVAWQGPNLPQSVIPGRHFVPWNRGRYAALAATNGILREYWTNFTAGDLAGLRAPGPFESALMVEQLRVLRRAAGPLPAPVPVSFAPHWMARNNYRWVEAAGVITFKGEGGDHASFELADSKAQVQLRTGSGASALSEFARNVPVRIRGVCEAILDETGASVPGWIWLAPTNGISVLEPVRHDAPRVSPTNSLAHANRSPQLLNGFYGTRGTVTFSGRVFDKDCLFVQEGSAAIFVSLKECQPRNQLQVGQWLDLGGTLEAGKSLPTIAPLFVKELGWRALPAPVTEPIHAPIPHDRDGKWSELEGVVRSVQSNGTLLVMGAKGPVPVWIGGASPEPGRYVDAKVRVRGVLSLNVFEHPVLLVPSRSYVEVVEPAPANLFGVPVRAIAELARETDDPSSLHRVRLAGQVTLRDAESFFVQDASGAVRVQMSAVVLSGGESPSAPKVPLPQVGDAVEVVGFPTSRATLTEARVRPASGRRPVQPATLDLADTLLVRQNGFLVRAAAELLAQRTVGRSHILELREQQRIFTATLPASHRPLPRILRGSRVEVIGVCDRERSALPAGLTAQEQTALGSLNLWLRTPADVQVLSGPPWWTWQRAAALIGTLLAVSSGALLWVHLLRRRLQRQQAAQLAASHQILKRLEEERRRIAANLHDSLGQILLAIKNQTLLALQRAPDENALHERLGEISGATSQALEEVRQITHGLRPYQLDRLGLTQALRATVSRASANSTILFASRVEDIDGVFDQDSEIHVYRIVQEAINNVLKHSGATETTVVIKKRWNHGRPPVVQTSKSAVAQVLNRRRSSHAEPFEAGQAFEASPATPTWKPATPQVGEPALRGAGTDHVVSLSIRDNGRGFDVAARRASPSNALGYGLSGMAERVRILAGELTIDSQPGGGTSLNVEIPVSQPCRSQ